MKSFVWRFKDLASGSKMVCLEMKKVSHTSDDKISPNPISPLMLLER